MTATLNDHTYTSGKRFCTVECDDCLTVLNSGHHYTDENRHHAETLAARHNAEFHTPIVPATADERREAATRMLRKYIAGDRIVQFRSVRRYDGTEGPLASVYGWHEVGWEREMPTILTVAEHELFTEMGGTK